MIANYTRPQTEIAQRLETTANSTLDRIHAVVVGPAYIHADADADNLVFQTYQEGDELDYQLLRDGATVTLDSEVVDQDAVRVIAKNLRLELFSAHTDFTALVDDENGNVIQYVDGVLDTEDTAIAEAFDSGRAPTPGDIYRIVSVADSAINVERKVVGLLGQDQDAAIGDSNYSGAEGSSSAATDEVSSTFASFAFGSVTLTGPGDVARLYARRNGTPGLADNEGLRLLVEVICTSGAGVVAGSTFQATVNGLAVTPTVAPISSTGTEFLFFTDLYINLAGYAAWATGDRIVFAVDVEHNPDTQLFDSSFDLTGYTYFNSTKRAASSLTVDVLSLGDDGAPTVRISDTAGLMTPVTVALTASSNAQTLSYDGGTIDFELTLITWDFRKFHVGQRYALPVTPPSRSTTFFDKVQLNAPIGVVGSEASFTVTAYVEFSGSLPAVEEILNGTNYTVAADSVTLDSLGHAVAGYPVAADSVRFAEDGKGTVAVQWRAVIPSGESDGLVAIDALSDITDNFYSAAMGSELGYGLAQAFSGSQGKRIYALNTGGSTAEDFTAAFDKLEAATTVYALAILTEDEDIMALASAHSQAMSVSTIKRFRRAYVGTDSPGEYPILELQDDDTAFSASISIGSGAEYTLVTFGQEDLDLGDYTITRGDKLLITGTGQTYLIESVTGEQTLTLQAGPASPVGETSCQIIAADTPANTARYVYERSGRLGANIEEDRRICNVWVHEGRLDNTLIPNRFIACEVAGIRTALQPQQGLTRTEIAAIDSAPAMYTKFKPSLLDTMAANGVWIISQNSAEGDCHVRHQLTTAVAGDAGSLYYEDSAGVNIDSVCFAIDDICDPKIGKRNATPRTVVEIKNELHGMLSGLTQDDYDSEIGPQLVKFYNSNGDTDTLDVKINDVYKDRIDVAVVLEIPLPLNNIRVVVMARTIKGDGMVVTALSTAVSA